MNPSPDTDPACCETEKGETGKRALLFATLSILWIFPSLGALWILGTGLKEWRQAPGLMDLLRAIRIEEWIALGLLFLHAVFIYKARSARTSGSHERVNGS